MLPLGHLAIAYLCYSVSTSLRTNSPPSHGSTLIILGSSQFPDLVDKPLAWYLGVLPSGRSLGHSVLVIIPLAIGLSLLTRRFDRGEYGIAFAIGAISHTLLDILSQLWAPATQSLFWPLFSTPISPVFAAYRSPLWALYFLSEIIFAAVAVVRWSRDGAPGLVLICALLERESHPSE